MVTFEILIHSSLNIISAFLLLLIGFIILSRKKDSRNNQALFSFFFFLGLFELFDAFVIGFRRDPSLSFLNILKDFAVSLLVLSLACGFLAVITIYYGDRIVFQTKYLLIWIIFTVMLIFMAVIGENIPESSFMTSQGFYMTVLVERDLFGILGINGAGIIFSLLMILYLLFLVFNPQFSRAKGKTLRLLLGFILIIFVIFIFDFRLLDANLRSTIAGSDLIHIILHSVLFFGEILILSAFWSQLEKS